MSARSQHTVSSGEGPPSAATAVPGRRGRAKSMAAPPGRAPALSAASAFAAAYLAVAALRPPDHAGGVVLVGLMAALLAVSLFALAAQRFGVRVVVLSPLAFVALAQTFIFGVRPAAVALWPDDGAFLLVLLGFRFADLGRTAAVGALAMSSFGVAFALVWEALARRRGRARPPGLGEPLERHPNEPFDDERLRFVLLRAAAAGTVLWAILFFRNGGFAALFDDPSRLHLNQFGGGHYVFGYALCLAAALVALQAVLEERSRQRLLLFIGLGTVAFAASVALQTRGQLLATAVAALALVLLARRTTRRQTLALAALAIALLAAFAWMRSVRELSHTVSFGEAARLAVTDRPLLTATRDFVEFDHFVALSGVVPDERPYLYGRSLAEVPLAFLPRQLYPDKPLPLDFDLAQALLGSGGRAGTPFTVVGELYWNFGWLGAFVAAVILGGGAGAGWYALVRTASRTRQLVAALVLGYSYLLLTRPLGAMAMTASLAVVAVVLVAVLAERLPLPDRAKSAR